MAEDNNTPTQNDTLPTDPNKPNYILQDIFKKLLFFSSPTANFSSLFTLLVSALPLGAKWNQSFAVGENKKVQ
jgi:hypothetical protein